MGTASSNHDVKVEEKSSAISAEASAADSSSSGISYDREIITPEKAATYLERALDPLPDKKAISVYAQSMKNKAWIMNGFPIIFDREGRVLDGVQRLNACLVADVPFKTFVARNVSADTLHTIDQHRKRTYISVLESRGVKNAGTIMRTMSKLIKLENGALGKGNLQISWSRYDRVFETNPELIEAVEIADSASQSYLHSTARPVLAFMAIRADKREKLVQFLTEMSPNHTLSLDSPPRMLSIQFTLKRGEGEPYSVDRALALSIIAFNAFCKNEKVDGYYSWKPDYGDDVRLDEEGVPLFSASVRDHAPDNLGFPILEGYPGIRNARFNTKASADEFGGRTDEEIKSGVVEDDGEEHIINMLVTPDMAREWLKYNSKNRKVMANHVKAIARDIRAGNWQVNAQPICFTANPTAKKPAKNIRLLNGQHRLRACIEADLPIEVPIGYNIPEEAFATFDNHAKSTPKIAGLHGAKRIDDRILAAAARLQWRQDNNLPLTGSGSPSASEIKMTLEKHPHLIDGFTRARNKQMADLGSAGVMAYFIYRSRQENYDYAEEFLDGIQSGANVPAGSPILSFRNHARGQRGKISRADLLNLLLEHWEAFKEWKMKRESKEAKKAS